MKALTTKSGNKTKGASPFFKPGTSPGYFGVQAKLKIGKANDPYEKEADNVADRVTSESNSKQSGFFQAGNGNTLQTKEDEKVQKKPIHTITPFVQLKEADEEPVQKQEEEIQKQEEDVQKQEEEAVQSKEENIQKKEEEGIQKSEEEVQGKEDENIQKNENEDVQKAEDENVQQQEDENVQKEEEDVQKKPAATATKSADTETLLKSTKGNGSPLPDGTRTEMEDSFGANLNGVKIHTDGNAEKLSKQLGAKAFTNKDNIYFSQGMFNPASREGKHLLAHEITHTIQQGAVQEKTEKDGEQTDVGASSANKSSQQARLVEETKEKGEAKVKGQDEVKTEEIKHKKQEAEKGKKKTKGKKGAAAGKVDDNYPKSPQEDPSFNAVKTNIKTTSGQQQAHNPAEQESQSAQSAAVSPANERQSMAQAGQVETMDKQEPGEFDAAAFKKKLMERIKSMQLPKNPNEADNFEDNNNISEVSSAAQSDVSAEKTKASGSIEQATAQEPNTEAVPERKPEPLPDPNIGAPPPSVNANKGMPKERPESQVSQPLQDNMQDVDKTMADNEVTDEQLGKANEPQFSEALGAKNEAKKHTKSEPNKFRAKEKQTLAKTEQQAQTQGNATLTGMHGDRAAILTQMVGQQQQTGTQDTAERQRIATEINGIYEQAKTDVEAILSKLDEDVKTKFSDAAKKAKKKFEKYVDKKMDAYKDKRYSGLRGKGRWLIDKFKGLPDEVNEFFVDGRQVYIDEMDIALTDISRFIATKLSEAKKRINKGKQDVANYVKALPESLQKIGKETAEGIQSKFDELESNVDSKQDDLIDSLAKQYSDSLAAVDARIEEMKAANRGLIDKALGAIMGVVKIIIQIKNTLTSLLSSAISVIKSIIADPIGFLGNLLSGIGQGFKNFGKNIMKHLTSGLIAWLTGSLGPMGITIPKDLFSLKGIFSLVMQILGLTWDYIRKKAVKLLGEKVVSALETGFEIFQIIRKEGIAGLWKYLKEKFSDLKETVLGAIKEMIITKVIEAGIKWVLGLMSPAGAFVKAALMIIDIVKFFIERGSQIIELVKAFIEGVKAVASGSVQKVANAIENALAKAIPVLIGFLASLLGIGGLASKVQKLIKKIRSRIDKAIDKVILKAKKWFKKAGSKVKGAAAKIFSWWKIKKNFKSKDGKSHKLFFKGTGKSAKLMVASVETPLTKFLDKAKPKEGKESLKTNALAKSREIDSMKANKKAEKDKAAAEKIQKDIDTKMGELVPIVNELMTGENKKVQLLVNWLNKKVTEPDDKGGEVLKKFSDEATTTKDTKKHQIYIIDSMKSTKGDRILWYRMRRGTETPNDYMAIHINENGILLPGNESKKYIPPHSEFDPKGLNVIKDGKKYVAKYKTKQLGGTGKEQDYTVDIKFDEIEKGHGDYNENRKVVGKDMLKKPRGRGRGKHDSAGNGFDNAHLIGDRFGGTGYNQSFNIYPSSPNYNQKTMADVEDDLFPKIFDNTEFKMTVDATIKHTLGKEDTPKNEIMDKLLSAEIKKDTKGKTKEEVEKEMIKKMRSYIKNDLNKIPGQFIKVNYKVEQDKNTNSMTPDIGVDSDYDTAIAKRRP